jgi:O-antigen/teichoic acid export membrane protein
MYLVRTLSPAEFGLYGICFAVSLYYAGIGNALFLTQMVVHLPEKAEQDRLHYAARTLIAVTLGCLLTLLLSAVIIGVGGLVATTLSRHASIASAVVFASVGYLLKDYFVRLAYSDRQEVRALLVNTAVALTLAAALTIWLCGGYLFTAAAAVWIYALAQLSGSLVGFAVTKLPVRDSCSWQLIWAEVRQCWHGGRWALGGVTVTWLQSQAYLYVTVLFLGPAGVGQANAARLLITPFMFLLPAVNQVTMPALASLRVADPQKMIRQGKLFTAGMIGLLMGYMLLLSLTFTTVQPLMTGSRYENLGMLVIMWGAVTLLMLARDGASLLLQSLKEFRAIMVDNTLSAIVAVLAAALCAKYLGTAGAVLGTVAGELILAVLLWKRVSRHEQHLR